MNMRRTFKTMLCLALMMGCVARADVTVSLQIHGTIDEILPILQLLKSAGVGSSLGAEEKAGLKLELNSVAEVNPSATEAAPETSPVAGPVPTAEPEAAAKRIVLGAPKVEPAVSKPGEQVLVTLEVKDPAKRVHTVAASEGNGGAGSKYVDLYDDGTHGDATPNDGVWSYQSKVSENAAEGEFTFRIVAFDANGQPLTQEDENGNQVEVATEGRLIVKKP